MFIPIKVENEEHLIGIEVDIVMREVRMHYSDFTTKTQRYTEQEWKDCTIQLQFI